MERIRRWLAAGLLCAAPIAALAQEVTPPPRDTTQVLRLFLDCATQGCDFDYLRTQLTWIDYVRDRTAGDVHVITSSLGTGGGGSEVLMRFVGRGRFAGVDDEIRYPMPQGATSDEHRAELTRFLKLGLARYLVRMPQGRHLTLSYAAPVQKGPPPSTNDPWKLWVFSVGMNGYLSGESSSKFQDLSGNVSSSRTTKDWKFNIYFSGNKSDNSFDLGDGTTYESNSHSYYASGLIVKSLGDHLSAGASFSGSSSTQENIDLRGRFAPTVEYDFFKYAEYTKRRLIAQYSIGFNRYDYTEVTIFDREEETRVDQRLSLTYATRTTWGNANIGASASNYLSDFKQNRLSINGGMNIRIFKGLSFNYSASYARVRDQITLPRDGASDEEILLRLKRLRTNYQYYGFFGLNYTFGSVFNNVVNPCSRPGGGGGGGSSSRG
jgi:hypothetical protein